ncbi:RNA polymerase sigma factor, sigma-70 family [Desulfatibacillum alkenivorans DSM 16219]|jgi:RNA polymerase sigma factor (sigma-70 family)|uniref:RNA polymerase sigma factor, sigma-70 family n=1 Tax=Desulfatibacillum alkenivorans DSM 16219 TaxID=1121393 RepID=A0A1M6WRT0_9BACT|nr:RNA polymerase sigma factor [Desulfatibacillum alkenivorans]SHK96428.1 RNA polymerase sigma factor, sigma-70 family [Desulfatibacillum alkenivorans DSM 16219]
MNENLENLAIKAKQGDKHALESIVRAIQHRIFGLALKMLYHPQDAEDAVQEILIRIITNLGSFAHKSSFDTWALKVASNHLMGVRKKRAAYWFTFERRQAAIVQDPPDAPSLDYDEAEQELIVKEMRLACMQGLLQCLDWEHRIVYILGETMGIPGPEGAAILDIKPAAFRKRLSRAREKIREFLSVNCDLYEKGNPCNCLTQGTLAMQNGLMDLKALSFADQGPGRDGQSSLEDSLKALEHLTREAAIMRCQADCQAPRDFVRAIRRMLDSEKFQELKTLN